MLRKPETIAFWRGRLPHWEVVDGRYFVTLHLRGAIPSPAQARIVAMSNELQDLPRAHPRAQLSLWRRVFSEMEKWLDRTGHVDFLRTPSIAAMVMEAIQFRQQRDWNMFEFVVMPSHLHLFFELTHEGLKSVMEQFKRWTGHEALKRLGDRGKRFWQDEWFDHWSRSDEEDERIVQYIRRNPEKANLVDDFCEWAYGSWHKDGRL